MFNIPRLVIAGPHRSAGKTTVSLGLCGAFHKRGLKVQSFKKGPDYIDPMWMTSAGKRECRNLDFHMMGDENILRSFQSASKGAQLSVIEGNLGLYDGLHLDGEDSTAGLAHLLEAPVIIVVDSSRMNRGVAALLFGYKGFDPDLNIAGVILNKVGSARHESKLRQAIDKYVGIEILGVIPKLTDKIGLLERHLGLVPIKEDPSLNEKIDVISEIIETNCNMERLLEIARDVQPLPEVEPCHMHNDVRALKIGVAMDHAFNFYYPENLDALSEGGAEIVPFSPVSDAKLPEVNALYIGGGFPEVFMDDLEKNKSMRNQIKFEIKNGLPVYAECGGMMYLSRSISWKGEKRKMVGSLPCDIEMTKKPMGLGYMNLESTGQCGWHSPKGEVHCHEFHHSKAVNIGPDINYAWRVTRGAGIAEGKDGMLYKNVLASYAHHHYCGAPTWASDFIALIKKVNRTVVTMDGVEKVGS